MLPHVTEDGAKQIHRTLEELDEMQKYVDPERLEWTPELIEKRRIDTRKKVHGIMDFLRGDK